MIDFSKLQYIDGMKGYAKHYTEKEQATLKRIAVHMHDKLGLPLDAFCAHGNNLMGEYCYLSPEYQEFYIIYDSHIDNFYYVYFDESGDSHQKPHTQGCTTDNIESWINEIEEKNV